VAYRKTRRVFTWIGLVPVLLAGAAFWSRSQYRQSVRLVEHTREVLAAIDNVLILLTDAETDRRGFVLTGDPRYLAPIEAAAKDSQTLVAHLSDLTRDNPVQQENASALKRLVTERMDLLKETARASGSKGPEAVRAVERESGLAISAQLRQVTSRMIAEEERLLAERQRAVASTDLELGATFTVGAIATILLLVWAYRIVHRYAEARDSAEAQLIEANRELEGHIAEVNRLNRELEGRVQERTASLQRSNDDLQQFAYAASHDLQEPLRTIASFVALLARRYQGKLDSEADKYIGFVIDGSKRMQVLINDLLLYSRAGTQALTVAPAKLNDVVRQAELALLERIRETEAQITVGDLPELEVDALKMSMVFQNLLSNGIKFRKPGQRPRIYVESENRDGEMRISVRDEGIGFEPQYAEKIFVIFQRLHGIGKYPGTGIGLALCKRIIESHGGRIWAESEPNQGAVIYFTLPQHATTVSARSTIHAHG
jgi:signal transduction histidine kinase